MSRTVIAVLCVVGVLLLLPIVAKAIRGSEPPTAQPSLTSPSAASGSPAIVTLDPPNGATGVTSSKTELRVTFSVPMEPGFSVTGGGPQFPPMPAGQQPYWLPDRKTCVIPVQLQPNCSYMCGLNSKSFRNFKSETGVPLEPIVYRFNTGS